MAVTVVQNREYTPQPKQASYLKNVIAGGVIGYALKYALPVIKDERDENFKAYLKETKMKAKQAKLDEFEAIKNAHKKAKGTDEFVNIFSNKRLNITDKIKIFKQLDKDTQKNVKWLIEQVNDKSREINVAGKKAINAAVKDIRPTHTFIAAGVGVAALGTLIYNIIQRASNES